MDLRGFDLGLVEDKLERAVREASSNLLPIPLTTTVAAGTRSALVVDIGWKETHVTAIFEYREVYSRRSNRAGKTLSREMQKLLIDQLRRTSSWNEAQTESKSEANCLHVVSFEECEEVLARVAWCQSLDQIQTSRRRQTNPDQQSPSSIGSNGGSQESLAMMGGGETSAASLSPRLEHDPEMKVPLTSTKPPVTIELPFSHLALPVEVALFEGSPGNAGRADDDELPISDLAYEVLLTIPEDVRATCMSRIIVTGGGSQIPGMKQRLVQEVQRSVESHGWDKVRGEAIVARKLRMEMAHQNKSINEEEASNARSDNSEPKSDQETDPITARFLRDDLRKHKSTIKGVVRGIESLGAWTGASLAAALRIRSAVELERDKFLSQGLLGVMRSGDGGVTSQRLSGGVGDSRSSISDGWKGGLGAWV
ncbi:MAG: hypothetical protein M1817_001957 [Caeruleum heppii]|nr:MAG: hypothetical protein M1817_001957 [Caeruleum heppii]